MILTYEKIWEDLRARRYAPVYFLHGEESFFIDRIAQHVEQHVLAEHERGFNQVILYGKDHGVADVLNHARRFPMMAERQVVIVREAQEIPDLGREAGRKMLTAYLQQPLPSTVLIFCHKHKAVTEKKWLKVLESHAVVMLAKKLYDNQVPSWIERYLKAQGHQIAPTAQQVLAESIGTDLSRLANELDKLVLSLNGPTRITPELVQTYIGISKDYNVFELQSALTRRDAAQAFRIAHYFAADPKGHPVIPTLAVLFGFFAKVLLVHATASGSESELARVLKVHPFFVKDYQRAARAYSPPQVVGIVAHLRTADLQAKGIAPGTHNDGDILRELIWRILHDA